MPEPYYNIFADVTQTLRVNINPYVKKMTDGIAGGSLQLFHGPLLADRKGTWRQYFADKRGEERTSKSKLILEIGCYMGQTLIHLAQKHPECNFIGMDITFKRVVSTASRAQELGLKNVAVLLADANHVEHLFAPGEIDQVLAFFPDPWMKKKSQNKNQLFRESFCQQLVELLAEDGGLWVKTDQEPYMEKIHALLGQVGFSEEKNTSLHGLANHVTPFESLYRGQNLGIFEKLWFLHKKLGAQTTNKVNRI